MKKILLSSVLLLVVFCSSAFAQSTTKPVKINNETIVNSTGEITYEGYQSLVEFIDHFAGEHGFKTFIEIAFKAVTDVPPPIKVLEPKRKIKDTTVLKKMVSEMERLEATRKLDAVRDLVKDATSIIDAIDDPATKAVAKNALEALQESQIKHPETPVDVFDSIIESTTGESGGNQ